MTKRYLITGATGFIGRRLVRELVRCEADVTCLVRRSSAIDDLEALRVRLVYGDVCDSESLHRAVSGRDVVCHLAGLNKTLSNAEFHEINIAGVERLAAACAAQQNPPVLMHLSSLAAAGPTTRNVPLTEQDLPHPVSHYGKSKRAGERVLQHFAARLPITILRPPAVLGEGDTQAQAMFRMISRYALHVQPGFSPGAFSVVHLDDLVAAILLAAERGQRLVPTADHAGESIANLTENTPEVAAAYSSHGIYFVTADQQPSYAELGRMIAEVAGRKRLVVLPVPHLLLWIPAVANEGLGKVVRKVQFLNLDKAREATAGSWFCSGQKLCDDLGFHPQKTLHQRLLQTYQWYQAAGWL